MSHAHSIIAMEDFKFQLEAEKESSTKGQVEEEGGLATYTDPTDGTVYEWDNEKRAWFPKVCNFINCY